MSLYILGWIRHTETKVFNKALIQGSLIAYVVSLLLPGEEKQFLINI